MAIENSASLFAESGLGGPYFRRLFVIQIENLNFNEGCGGVEINAFQIKWGQICR